MGFDLKDTREHSEAAKRAINGLEFYGRILCVRHAPHPAAVRVKHLHQFVSDELLREAFSQFGEIERALIVIDARGKHAGEGIVEFSKKRSAMEAVDRISENAFMFGRCVL